MARSAPEIVVRDGLPRRLAPNDPVLTHEPLHAALSPHSRTAAARTRLESVAADLERLGPDR